MPPVAISPSSKYLPNWVSEAGVRSFIAAQDSRPAIALALVVSLVACGQDVEWIDARIEIARPTASSCRLDSRAELTLHALGDFPAAGNTVEAFDPADGPLTLDRFPLDTRYLRFVQGSPEIVAGVAVELSPRWSPQRALLLLLGQSCPSPDFEARARDGAAVTALPDGSLFIAGGRDDDFGDQSNGAAVSVASMLPPGHELVQQVVGGMFLRRSGATATVVDDEVWVIGGAAHDRGPAHDTYERFDPVTRRFTTTAASKLLHGPRRDHAAIALADGSGVLVVSGVSELGTAPLSTAEIVTAAGAVDVPGLTIGRSHPVLHLLSDGRVLIVGGVDVDGNVTGTVEAFDPATGRISRLAAMFTDAERAQSASLIGDRVAWLGCDGVACSLALLQRTDRDERVIAFPTTLPTFTHARAVGLPDGALLVVGQRRVSDLAEAWRVNFGAGTIEPLAASRAATILVALADGTVAELDGSGMSLRRDRIVTPFDHPPATLLVDDAEFVLDHSAHWTRVSSRIVAQVDDARFDVAGLMFGAFALTLDLQAPTTSRATLRLGGPNRAVDVTVDGASVSVGSCHVDRANDSESVTVVRLGNQLTLGSGDAAMQCTTELPEHVSIAVIADRGCALGPIQLARR